MDELAGIALKLSILSEHEKGGEIAGILNIAAYLAPTEIRIGLFSPIISNRCELKDHISILRRLSLVQCPKETTFFVPEDIAAKLRTFVSFSDRRGKEEILELAIAILLHKPSEYSHCVSVYSHAKGHPLVLEQLGGLPGVIVCEMLKDGKYREAAEFGKECRLHLTKALGQHHRVVLVLEAALGLALVMIGRAEEAAKLLISTYHRSCRFSHQDEMEIALRALAKVILAIAPSIERAETRLRKIVFPRSSVAECTSHSDLSKWVGYAGLLIELDLVDKGLSILDVVVRRTTALFGPDDVRFFFATELKAITLAASEKADSVKEAMELLERTYERKKEIFGPLSLKTLFVKGLMAQALIMNGNLEKGMTLLEYVVRNIKRVDEESVQLYEKEMKKMVEVCVLQKNFAKALQLSSDLLDNLVSVYGNIHEKCFDCRKRTSDIFLKLDQPEKALEVLRSLMEDYKYDMDDEELESFSSEMRRIGRIRSFQAPAGSLHSLARDGHSERVLSLIADGKDVESRDSDGMTPLHYAAAFGQTEVAKALIGKGARFASTAPLGSTPLNMAQGSEMAGLLRTVRSFFDAVKSKRGDAVVAIALAEPCVLGARDEQGCTPLHWAALRGCEGVCRLLLEFGCDATAASDKGNSALHIAASKGHTAIAEILLRSLAGPAEVTAALDAKTVAGGNTPLHAAAEKGHAETVRSLLAHGSVCNAKNSAGKTPLQVSEVRECKNLLGLLEGLFLDAANGDDATVRQKLRGLEPCDVLVVSKARNDDHRSLLQVAVKQKNLGLAKILVMSLDYYR